MAASGGASSALHFLPSFFASTSAPRWQRPSSKKLSEDQYEKHAEMTNFFHSTTLQRQLDLREAEVQARRHALETYAPAPAPDPRAYLPQLPPSCCCTCLPGDPPAPPLFGPMCPTPTSAPSRGPISSALFQPHACQLAASHARDSCLPPPPSSCPSSSSS